MKLGNVIVSEVVVVDLIMYSTLGLFILAMFIIFFWVFVQCQNDADRSSRRYGRKMTTVDIPPVREQRSRRSQQLQPPLIPNKGFRQSGSSRQEYSYNTWSTFCDVPIVEV